MSTQEVFRSEKNTSNQERFPNFLFGFKDLSHLDKENKSLGQSYAIHPRSTTEIYLHSIGESERKAMAIYESFSEKSHTDSHTEMIKELAQNG